MHFRTQPFRHLRSFSMSKSHLDSTVLARVVKSLVASRLIRRANFGIKITSTYTHVHLVSLPDQALGESIALSKTFKRQKTWSESGLYLQYFNRPWLDAIRLTSFDLYGSGTNQQLIPLRQRCYARTVYR